jgi:hypothetical protein
MVMAKAIDFSQELIFASSDSGVSGAIGRAERNEQLRKIAPRIYTANLHDSAEVIIRRHLLDVLRWRFPQAVISHRSALELAPTESGNFFITAGYTKRISDLPGVTLNVMQGKPALDSDVALGNIFLSSEYRWMLENMQPSRKRGSESKTFPIELIEQRLEQMLVRQREDGINKFRDKAREVAAQLDMQPEFERLNRIIGALLKTYSSRALHTASAKARAAGMPFDAQRNELFETLFSTLKSRYFQERPDRNISEKSFALFAFFEAYFSNYIEGTVFTIADAKKIIETRTIIPKRVKDSHDILGTFDVVSNRYEMAKTPATADELIALLKHRHSVIMAGRAEDVNAGQFKDKNNRAGSTEFVDFSLVEGTLRKGFAYYAALTEPMAKALFIMFLVSEVHPFSDGNGRISRILGNAELCKAAQSRIIVPTVFREDYILSLKKFTHTKNPDAYIRVMDKLQLFSSQLVSDDFAAFDRYLTAANAYKEPAEARLEMPSRFI